MARLVFNVWPEDDGWHADLTTDMEAELDRLGDGVEGPFESFDVARRTIRTVTRQVAELFTSVRFVELDAPPPDEGPPADS